MTCPHCGEAARFVDYRDKRFTTLVGDLRFARGYYACQHCGEGHVPIDAALRMTGQSLSPAAREVITLAGIESSFPTAADRALRKLTGLRRSESTIQRTTEDAGRRLGERLAAGDLFGPPSNWKWHEDLANQTCGYISIDATGILMQGPGGAKAEGRMINLGMVYNPTPRVVDDAVLAKPCEDVRYLAGFLTLDELGAQLRRQAAQVGMDKVDQWVALSDAGQGFERFFDVYFPRAAKIVDFRHATEHLTGLAKGLGDDGSAKGLLATWCHQLKHEGGASVLAMVTALDRATMDAATRVAHDDALTYFGNHHERMKYPEYLAKGWQIGSGSVESACKNVVNQRLSMGGMRWGEEGGDAVAHLRALFRSEASQWDAFWSVAA